MVKLPWRLRWWELLPEALLGLGLGLFVLIEPSAATSAFKSRTALTLMTVVAAVWLVVRVVIVRFTRVPALRTAVFAVAAVGVLSVVVYPAFDNNTVVEALPATRSAAPTTTTIPASDAVATTPKIATTPTATPQPVALRSSAIHGIDHRATGTAVIYRQPDGSFVVGLEDIDIQPGPDYDVYLVAGGNREDIDGGVRLDDLRGNKGTQYYDVPTGADVATGKWTVLVWCVMFAVPIAGSTPA